MIEAIGVVQNVFDGIAYIYLKIQQKSFLLRKKREGGGGASPQPPPMLRACNKVAFSFCSEGAFARKGGYFSLGEDDAMHVLDDVNCTGTEKSIMQCSHRGVQHTDCSHINDAGVTCINEMPKGMLCQCSVPNRWLHVILVYKNCLVRGYNQSSWSFN